MNKSMKKAIGKTLSRLNMSAGILLSLLPEVLRVKYEQNFGKAQAGSSARSAQADGCPVPHGQSASPTTAAAGCPVTGHGAASDPQETVAPKTAAMPKEAATKTATKAAQAKKAAPKKAAPAKKEATKKAEAKKPAAKKPAAKKAAAKKAAAKKAAPKAAQTSAKAAVDVSKIKPEELKSLKRQELYELAQALDIAGRKDKKKSELIELISEAIQ